MGTIIIFIMSPDILTSLSSYLMVLLAVLLVDKSMYDIGLIHPKSSAAQKNPLLIAQCSTSALLSSSNNRVSQRIEIKAGHPKASSVIWSLLVCDVSTLLNITNQQISDHTLLFY